MKQREYDITSSQSILNYGMRLLRHSLRELHPDAKTLVAGGQPTCDKEDLRQIAEGHITHPDATNVRQKHLRTQLLCTTHNYPSRLNHQIDFFPSRKSANGWCGEYLLNSECTPANCQVYSSTLRASAPS